MYNFEDEQWKAVVWEQKNGLFSEKAKTKKDQTDGIHHRLSAAFENDLVLRGLQALTLY